MVFKAITTLSVALVLAAGSASAATAPAGVMGQSWGAAPPAGLTPVARIADEGFAVYTQAGPSLSYLGIPVRSADMAYSRGHLFSADLYFEGDAAQRAVTQALVAAYGEPLERVDSRGWRRWSWSEPKIDIRVYADAADGGTVVSISRED